MICRHIVCAYCACSWVWWRCWSSYLFPVVQALVVIFQHGLALGLALVVLGVGIYNIAGEDFLPEGKAARGTWRVVRSVTCSRLVVGAFGRRARSVWDRGALQNLPPLKPYPDDILKRVREVGEVEEGRNGWKSSVVSSSQWRARLTG